MDVETFVVPPFDNNVYLVSDPDAREAALIDTSLSAAKVLPRLTDLGLTLKFILNTHGHPDHVADNAPIAKATGAKVGVHEADVYRLEQIAKAPPPYVTALPAPKPDLVLKEGTVVKVGSIELRVLHTPGHTEGSVCVHEPLSRQAFVGDTLFAGTHGGADLLGGSPAKLYMSLRRLYELPPDTRVLPGHGPATRIGDEAWIPNVRYAAPH